MPNHTAVSRRYAIRLGPIVRVLFTLMGAPARWDYVEVTPTTVRVRFAWHFYANIPIPVIMAVDRLASAVNR